MYIVEFQNVLKTFLLCTMEKAEKISGVKSYDIILVKILNILDKK